VFLSPVLRRKYEKGAFGRHGLALLRAREGGGVNLGVVVGLLLVVVVFVGDGIPRPVVIPVRCGSIRMRQKQTVENLGGGKFGGAAALGRKTLGRTTFNRHPVLWPTDLWGKGKPFQPSLLFVGKARRPP